MAHFFELFLYEVLDDTVAYNPEMTDDAHLKVKNWLQITFEIIVQRVRSRSKTKTSAICCIHIGLKFKEC